MTASRFVSTRQPSGHDRWHRKQSVQATGKLHLFKRNQDDLPGSAVDDPAKMAFTLPSSGPFPPPADERVRVIEVKPYVAAVARGRDAESLKSKVLKRGLRVEGKPWVAATTTLGQHCLGSENTRFRYY